MPPKASAWDNPELLVDLCIALYQAAEVSHGLKPEVKDAIGAFLQTRGHDTSWNAIRQHVQKLRKNRDTTGISAAAGGATPAVTPSGKNNAFAKTPGTKSGGGRKRPAPKLDFKVEKTESDIDGGIDDDEEFNKMMLKTEPKSDVNDTPSKPKRARTANTPKALQENHSIFGEIDDSQI